jgi:hypothetical protein
MPIIPREYSPDEPLKINRISDDSEISEISPIK